jgi:hypothetical protein
MTTKKTAPTGNAVYVNLVAVHITAGKDKGKEFAPGQHVSDLAHLQPLQIQLLLNQRTYAPYTPPKEN